MKISRVILSGVLGAVLVYAVVRLTGAFASVPSDLCQLLGSSITGAGSAWTWLLGAVGQLVLGVVASIVYAAIFESVTQRAGALIGLLVGLAHVALAGLAIGFLPSRRLLEAGVAPPGAFMEYRGVAIMVAFAIAHLAFGLLIGALYGRPRHVVTVRAVVWREA